MPSLRILLALILFSVCTAAYGTDAKPNIILLMGDDHGWEETGYYDHPYLHTPYLDEMARRGLRMDRFYAQPSCSPTRGNVLTGRHPNRYGIFRPGFSIRPEEITIGHQLKKAGYHTSHFGKWHVGPVKLASPTSPGAMGFDQWLSHDNFFELDPIFSRNGGKNKQHFGESSEIIVDAAIDYIKHVQAADNKQPFLSIIWFGSPHEPYSAIKTDLALYKDLPMAYAANTVSLTSNETGLKTKRSQRDVLIERYAEITAMDRAIGKLRNALKTLNLSENTLLWYCGDNGLPPSGMRDSKLRGMKGKVYENGIRVPCVIEWPAGIAKPAISTMNAVTSDILPTLCSLAGVSSPKVPLDGINLVPHLKGKKNSRQDPIEFWNFSPANTQGQKPYIDETLQAGTTPLVKQMRGLYTRNFKNYHHPEIRVEDFNGARAIISGKYKLVIDGDKKTGIELFDLSKDPYEKNNLVKTHNSKADELSRQLRNWQESVLKSLSGGDY